MKVQIHELRAMADQLLSELAQAGVGEIELKKDYYWSIPSERLYDPYKSPLDLTLGQLSDDLQELRSIQSGERPPLPYALVWLASLLRYVGEDAEPAP